MQQSNTTFLSIHISENVQPIEAENSHRYLDGTRIIDELDYLPNNPR